MKKYHQFFLSIFWFFLMKTNRHVKNLNFSFTWHLYLVNAYLPKITPVICWRQWMRRFHTSCMTPVELLPTLVELLLILWTAHCSVTPGKLLLTLYFHTLIVSCSLLSDTRWVVNRVRIDYLGGGTHWLRYGLTRIRADYSMVVWSVHAHQHVCSGQSDSRQTSVLGQMLF